MQKPVDIALQQGPSSNYDRIFVRNYDLTLTDTVCTIARHRLLAMA